jgi:hypothetical protein
MKLTVVDKSVDDLRDKTPPGMAFWAGTGPKRTTCRECEHYEFNGYKSNRGTHRGGTLKNGKCEKYATMMEKDGSKIPFDTPSCKYFSLNKAVPPIVNPRKD